MNTATPIDLTDLFTNIGRAAIQNGWDMEALINFMRQIDAITPEQEAIAIEAYLDGVHS